MTTTRYTSKGLTVAQRRIINLLPHTERAAAIREVHAMTPKWYNTDGIACCRLNNTSCDNCPNCD